MQINRISTNHNINATPIRPLAFSGNNNEEQIFFEKLQKAAQKSCPSVFTHITKEEFNKLFYSEPSTHVHTMPPIKIKSMIKDDVKSTMEFSIAPPICCGLPINYMSKKTDYYPDNKTIHYVKQVHSTPPEEAMSRPCRMELQCFDEEGKLTKNIEYRGSSVKDCIGSKPYYASPYQMGFVITKYNSDGKETENILLNGSIS